MTSITWRDATGQLKERFLEATHEKVLVLDVDDTILSGNAGALFSRYLYACGRLELLTLLKLPFYQVAYKFGVLNYVKMVERILESLKSCPISILEECGRQCYRDDVKGKLRSGAVALISELKELGYRIVLASSSPEAILKPLAHDLKVEWVSTRCEVVKGHYSGRVLGEPCYGLGKPLLLQDLFSDPCYIAFSDSITDRPLLEGATLAYVVTPGARLRRLARTKGWSVIDSD
jgi:HAD superfamily phosphoserine phosphatase-like hydrolase